VQGRRHHRGRPRDAGEEGRAHRPASSRTRSPASAVDVWVGNYVLMGYGDGAVMGVPGARRARLRLRAEVRHADRAGGRRSTASRLRLPRWQEWYADKARGVRDQLAAPTTRPRARRRGRRHRRRPRARGPGREDRRTWRLRDWGISRQRYWGTPDPDHPLRRAAARCRCPRADLPVVLPEDCIPDGSGNPLNKRADFLACDLPGLRQAARGARPTRWTPSSTRPGTTCATATRQLDGAMVDARHAATGCRWTSTSAASSTRSCTCCTRASGPR
jgi:leucyl-tRNA synthetase